MCICICICICICGGGGVNVYRVCFKWAHHIVGGVKLYSCRKMHRFHMLGKQTAMA
jgi:cytochrome b subunit of formate dehydrogenase